MNIDSKIKIYNDLDNSLVNIFETLRSNPGLVKDRFEYTLNSRRVFNECKIKGTDNAEDAFRKLYSYLMSFAGKGKYYGYSVKSKGNRLINIKENIDSIYNEIKYWTIEILITKSL